MNNIVDLFLDAAKKYPDHTAIIQSNQKITYAELANEVKKTATYFRQKGIGQGDRVLVFVPMSIDLYRIVLALFYVGATAVFLDEWVSKARLELCCRLADCKGFVGIFKARVFALFSKELRRIPIKLKIGGRAKETTEPEVMNDHDAALITFTTGSTGTPKAARRTHAFLKEQFDALIEEIEPDSSDVDMPVLPIVLFMNLGIGCASVIAPFNQRKPDKNNFELIANQVISNKVNRITASPFFIKSLAQHCLKSKTELPGLQKIFTGGAPVFPSEANLYKQAFPYTRCMIVYGSTESEPISSINTAELAQTNMNDEVGLPVGRVFHKIDLRIIKITHDPINVNAKDEFDTLSLPDGEIGEIVVAGPHVLKEYYDNDQAFKENKIVINGTIWHRTGDSGYLTGNKLFLTGRCKQLIKSEQGYISPSVVEQQLQQLPGVTMGTLIEKEGETILIIETKDAATTGIESLAVPYNRTVTIERIPRDPRHNSKIDYDRLKQMV